MLPAIIFLPTFLLLCALLSLALSGVMSAPNLYSDPYHNAHYGLDTPANRIGQRWKCLFDAFPKRYVVGVDLVPCNFQSFMPEDDITPRRYIEESMDRIIDILLDMGGKLQFVDQCPSLSEWNSDHAECIMANGWHQLGVSFGKRANPTYHGLFHDAIWRASFSPFVSRAPSPSGSMDLTTIEQDDWHLLTTRWILSVASEIPTTSIDRDILNS